MIKHIVLTVIISIVLFIIFYVSFFIAAFLLGYASNDNHIDATWRLYVYFALGNLGVNVLTLYWRKKMNKQMILVSSLLTITFYIVFALIFD